ncbi:LysR family transcriptional regulator [Sphingopyxis yananensis]|uniref:LysR family transcriptional regulator n=1 Tax=Sphingopyxis yananensis TaxID=2886687 RepID=UPI001D119951|nr:LysR family transcriptional regulator [Sphingopyxis yananensis]MCC2603627.1 LysR family transcriptional regulator [Sphingopyxis yananensis]
MIDWDNLRFFLTAVRAGNYTAAAKRLRVDRTTVGRRLERLEHQAGTSLFEQGDVGYQPTFAGRHTLAIADKIEALVTELETLLASEKGSEQVELRVAVAAELGSELLKDLAGFSRRHPHIRLRITTSHEPDRDVIARKCEVALCLVDAIPKHLRGARIATLRQAGYASETYLDHKGYALAPQSYDWVRCAHSSQVKAMKLWDEIFCPTVSVSAYVDSWAALRSSVEQGVGAAFLWTFFADAEPDLIRVTPLDEALGIGLFLVVRDDVPMDHATRQFMKDMVKELSLRMGN